MAQKPKVNGGIAELTPDAIRADGLSVAEHIRALGKKARTEAETVEAFAEQVASAIVEATSQVANRVGWLMENCQAARDSMEQHHSSLSALPEQRKALAPPASPMVETAGFAAVEKSLGDLEKAITQNEK
jgi:uncharacterized membrane protein YccC